MRVVDLLDDNKFIRSGLFYFPRAEFRKRPKEASKQFFHFNNALTGFFTNRFLSDFLTDINRKNKRTHRVNPSDVTPPDFESIDKLKCIGLCNQLIECFTIDYCERYDLHADNCIFPIKTEYNNNLQSYMTNCYAPFRRGPSIYYVDMNIALRDVLCEAHDDTTRAGKAALYLRLGGRETDWAGYVTIPPTTLSPDLLDVELEGLSTSTVGQLVFFRWFISSGSMKKLLELRETVVEFLENKRRVSLERKRKRNEEGSHRRERTISHREPRCASSKINLRIEKKFIVA
jgi:hypothetical protein